MAICKLDYNGSNQAALLSSLLCIYIILILIIAAYSFNYLEKYRAVKYTHSNLLDVFKLYIQDLFYRRLFPSILIIFIHLLDQITDISVIIIFNESSTSQQNNPTCKSLYHSLFITILTVYVFYKLLSFILLCIYGGLLTDKSTILKFIKLFITQLSEIEIINTIFENYLFDKLFHATKLITVIYSIFVSIPMCYIQFIYLFIYYNGSKQNDLIIFSLICSMLHVATSILCLYENIKYHEVYITFGEIGFVLWKLIDIATTMLVYSFCYFILGKIVFIIIMSLLICASIISGIITQRYLYCLFGLILNDIHTPLQIYQGLTQILYLILITIWIKVDVTCGICPSFEHRHSFIFDNKLLFGLLIVCWIFRFASCFPFFVFFRPKFYFFTNIIDMIPPTNIKPSNHELFGNDFDLNWNDSEARQHIILEREWYKNNYDYYDFNNKKTMLMLSVHVRSSIISHEILKRSNLWNEKDTQSENLLDYLFRSDRTIASNSIYSDKYRISNNYYRDLTDHYENLDFLTQKENEWISYLYIIYSQFPQLKSHKTNSNIFLCACFIGDLECVEKIIENDENIINSLDINGLNGYNIASLAHQEHICQFLLFEHGIGPNTENGGYDSTIANIANHKCILLGTASSGKSTLFKMISTIYDKDMSESECLENKHVICQNMVFSIIDLLRFTCDIGEEHKECFIDLNDATIKTAIEVIVSYSSEGFYDEETNPLNWADMKILSQSLEIIWNLNAIQETIHRNGDMDRNTHVMIANLEYFFDKISIIFSKDYIPTKEDILRTRVRTTGLIESQEYKINDQLFKIIDVGGTRNERKKWIHQLNNIDIVLFIASLASFNETLFEDEMMSSIKESVNLFDELIHCKYTKQNRTKIYLLFGQKDRYRNLLKSKGPKVVNLIKKCFDETEEHDTLKYLVYNDELFYTKCTLLTHGFVHDLYGNNFHIKDILKLIDLYCDVYWESFYNETIKYIRQKFLNRNRNINKQIKTFVLSFLSEQDVKNVMYQITNEHLERL